MTNQEAIEYLNTLYMAFAVFPNQQISLGDVDKMKETVNMAIKALQEPSGDLISRQAVNILVDELARAISDERSFMSRGRSTATIMQDILDLPSVNPQEPKTGQYEKHIDHTDCIWYGNDSGCPVTCSQYRDGWNDAMDYIFKNGKGYQPYRHDS